MAFYFLLICSANILDNIHDTNINHCKHNKNHIPLIFYSTVNTWRLPLEVRNSSPSWSTGYHQL